jgi:hypothetical protein
MWFMTAQEKCRKAFFLMSEKAQAQSVITKFPGSTPKTQFPAEMFRKRGRRKLPAIQLVRGNPR